VKIRKDLDKSFHHSSASCPENLLRVALENRWRRTEQLKTSWSGGGTGSWDRSADHGSLDRFVSKGHFESLVEFLKAAEPSMSGGSVGPSAPGPWRGLAPLRMLERRREVSSSSWRPVTRTTAAVYPVHRMSQLL